LLTVKQKFFGLLRLWHITQPACNPNQTPTTKHNPQHNPLVVVVHSNPSATTTKEKTNTKTDKKTLHKKQKETCLNWR